MTHPEPETLKNDLVSVTPSNKPYCRVELAVHATPALLAKAKSAAIKVVGKEVTVPGFRKGKAPDEMIAKKYGPSIAKEQEQQLADLAMREALPLVKIPLLNNNAQVSYQMKHMDSEGADLLFVYETEPVVPTVDPSLFVAQEVKAVEVGDVQTDEAIRQTMFYFADWAAVERPIQEGDYIMIDLDTIENGVPTQVFHHIRFEVAATRMAQWMKNLVVGAVSGAVLKGVSEADESMTEEEKKEFQPKQVKVTIVKVEEATLPALDNEFAKKVGAPDVAALRQSVFDLLKMQAETRVQEEKREQVNRFLTQQYRFELPLSLIDTEKKFRFQQLEQYPDFKESWDRMTEVERKKIDGRLVGESEQAIRLFYLSRQIIRDGQVPITHQEVQQHAAASRRLSGAKETDQISQEEMALAFSKVMLAKAQDFVLTQSKPS